MKQIDKKTAGLICTILGGIFFLSGIVLFILSNTVNLYSQKVVANILSKYEVRTDEPYVMLELCYRVGDEMITTMESFNEEIPDEMVDKEVYYDIRNPQKLVDGGWHFMPLWEAVFGLLILLPGLYYMQILTFGIEPRKKPGKNASKWDIEYYEISEKIENDIIPFAGAVALTAFGIIILLTQEGWWQWIIIAIGSIAAMYIGIDAFPSIGKYFALKKIKKLKAKSVTVDDDFEKFDRKIKEKDLVDKMKEEGFEIEETFEIKKSEIPSKKRKKRK